MKLIHPGTGGSSAHGCHAPLFFRRSSNSYPLPLIDQIRRKIRVKNAVKTKAAQSGDHLSGNDVARFEAKELPRATRAEGVGV